MDRLSAMKAFLTVAESQGFTAAAERLGVSRAAVSKQIIQLEEELGVRLLNRTTRRVSVTEVGQAYYERCQRVLAEVEEADLLVEQLHSEPRGTLTVNAPMSFGVSHVGPAIAEFLAAHPALKVALSLNDRFTDLIEGGFDVAVRIAQMPDSSLVARRLAPVPCTMAATPAYIARHGAPVMPDDLGNHPCLSYAYLASGREWRMTGPDGTVHAVRVDGPLRANNGDVLLQAARAGLGIAFLPEFIVRPALEDGALVRVMPDYALPELSVFAVSPPNRFPAAKVRSFIEFLEMRFGPTVG